MPREMKLAVATVLVTFGVVFVVLFSLSLSGVLGPSYPLCRSLNYTYKVQTLDTTYYSNNISEGFLGMIQLHGYCLYRTPYNSTIQVSPAMISTDY